MTFTLSQKSEVDLYFHAICAGGASFDEWSVREIEIANDAGEIMFDEIALGGGYESGSDTVTFEAGTYTAFALIHAYGENGSGSDASIFLEIAPTPVEDSTDPADFNGDGQVDGYDLMVLLSEWGASGGAADLDGSGTVDGGDLLVLLASWSA